jgi:hypothetical protein
MAQITLFTHERSGAGLTSTNICEIGGAVALRIVTQGMIRHYPLIGIQNSTIYPRPSIHPDSGKADLRLQTERQGDVNLARCKWAVSLVVVEGIEGNNTIIYWIDAHQCSKVEQCANFGFARAQIEGKWCREYELPPQIPSVVSCIG